jgi:hypothetical protein
MDARDQRGHDGGKWFDHIGADNRMGSFRFRTGG